MRFLLVSDLHYRLRQFDWLLDPGVDVDAVMIAGDLLDIRSPVALDVQALAVTTALRDLAATHHALRGVGEPRPRRPRRGGGEGRALDARRWRAAACTATSPRWRSATTS